VERLRAADARAGAATSGAPSTRLSDQELEDAVAALQSRIRAAEENGPNSPELIEPLSALGALYQESGQHLLAASAIKRAREVLRIHHGLYTLDQAPLLQRLIASAEAIGDSEAAWDLEQQL